jgi:hypothetical protein
MPASKVRVAQSAKPVAVDVVIVNSVVATKGVVVERVTVALETVTFAVLVCAFGLRMKLLCPNTLET